jgi:hypothetical protein
MIELKQDALLFSFPEVHKRASLRIVFRRTLRIPDDGRDYPLPPGLGRFPVRHVDDFAREVPEAWLRHGGVTLPMYQSEALWLNFDCDHGTYPFAIKVATGKINAVTGESWKENLNRGPQDYVVAPDQPWLDGYCVERGLIRQFVAMPLGSGYSAEEQITGEAEHGGLQILVYPMKAEAFERHFRRREAALRETVPCSAYTGTRGTALDMGLAPGGRMRQEIYDDPYKVGDWDLEHSSRCFVHIANSLVWRAITGQHPPTTPPTAREYTRAGLPWFEYYGGDAAVTGGSKILEKLKSVAQLAQTKQDAPLPENERVEPEKVIGLRKGLSRDQVREGRF